MEIASPIPATTSPSIVEQAPEARHTSESSIDSSLSDVSTQPTTPPTPLWMRLGAASVDGGVLGVLVMLAATCAALAFGTDEIARHLSRGFDYVLDGLLLRRHVAALLIAFGAVAFTAYGTVCHALFGATLGKHVFGLRVVTRDGENPGFGESLWRTVASGALFVLGGFGLAWMLVDPARHALHDRLVGTRVERTDREAPASPAQR